MRKLEATIEPWADVARDMVTAARKTIDEVLATQAEKCFEQDEWVSIMEADGARFEDAERVEWIMESVVRGISEKNAAALYQVSLSLRSRRDGMFNNMMCCRPLFRLFSCVRMPPSHRKLCFRQRRIYASKSNRPAWMSSDGCENVGSESDKRAASIL